MNKLISKRCVDFVKNFEGFYAEPYFDIVGVRTIGYGMTGNEIENLNYITESQASEMLENLLNKNYAIPIKNNLDSRGVELNQNEFDALVSMSYNIGVGGLLGSTLYKNICAGIRDKETIVYNFQAWSNAGGGRVQGLYRRRSEEAEMFFRNDNETMEDKKEMDMKKVIVYTGDIEALSAIVVSQRYNCPMMKLTDFEASGLKANEVIQIGGKVGSDRYSTFRDAGGLV